MEWMCNLILIGILMIHLVSGRLPDSANYLSCEDVPLNTLRILKEKDCGRFVACIGKLVVEYKCFSNSVYDDGTENCLICDTNQENRIRTRETLEKGTNSDIEGSKEFSREIDDSRLFEDSKNQLSFSIKSKSLKNNDDFENSGRKVSSSMEELNEIEEGYEGNKNFDKISSENLSDDEKKYQESVFDSLEQLDEYRGESYMKSNINPGKSRMEFNDNSDNDSLNEYDNSDEIEKKSLDNKSNQEISENNLKLKTCYEFDENGDLITQMMRAFPTEATSESPSDFPSKVLQFHKELDNMDDDSTVKINDEISVQEGSLSDAENPQFSEKETDLDEISADNSLEQAQSDRELQFSQFFQSTTKYLTKIRKVKKTRPILATTPTNAEAVNLTD